MIFLSVEDFYFNLSGAMINFICVHILNIFCISYFIFKTNSRQTLGTYLPSEKSTLSLSLKVGEWDYTGSNEDVLEMLDDLMLHGLSFELVRVISSIGKKNWLARCGYYSFSFLFTTFACSEWEMHPSFMMAMEYSVLK